MADTRNIGELFRRALAAQRELGVKEVTLDRPLEQIVRESRARTALHQPSGPTNRLDGELFGSDTLLAAPQYASLETHRSAICECQLCPLGKTRTKFVYGVGNPEARLMFIGEAPGADEDLTGEPFVGRAGQLLDKIIAAIQLSRSEVYIANILKCRPPNNRDPLPFEMETCFPYLREQIRLIRPRLLCALGRIAAQALLGRPTPLNKLRGEWHRFEGIPMLVTYHPAALLRYPAYKRDTWEDMQKLRAEYDRIGAER